MKVCKYCDAVFKNETKFSKVCNECKFARESLRYHKRLVVNCNMKKVNSAV